MTSTLYVEYFVLFIHCMCVSRKFCQKGSNTEVFLFFFSLGDGKKIEMPLKVCHHRPAIECWLGSFVIFRGSRSLLLGNPIFLGFFRVGRGGLDSLSPPLD